MITCHQCNHREFIGTLFCSNCGTQLVHPKENQPGTGLHAPHPASSEHLEINEPQYARTPPQPYMLYLIHEDLFITLADNSDTTLGRLSPDQVLTPDIDLSEYDAYEKGVSRLHATIQLNQKNQSAQIIDLGSANGTRINGTPIPANSEVPLHHHDVLSLGKLKIQVILGKHST